MATPREAQTHNNVMNVMHEVLHSVLDVTFKILHSVLVRSPILLVDDSNHCCHDWHWVRFTGCCWLLLNLCAW